MSLRDDGRPSTSMQMPLYAPPQPVSHTYTPSPAVYMSPSSDQSIPYAQSTPSPATYAPTHEYMQQAPVPLQPYAPSASPAVTFAPPTVHPVHPAHNVVYSPAALLPLQTQQPLYVLQAAQQAYKAPEQVQVQAPAHYGARAPSANGSSRTGTTPTTVAFRAHEESRPFLVHALPNDHNDGLPHLYPSNNMRMSTSLRARVYKYT